MSRILAGFVVAVLTLAAAFWWLWHVFDHPNLPH
jgi:hypothetical protein